MGKGPKAQILEILAALQGPQVQAEVLRAVPELPRHTVLLLAGVGGGEKKALTDGSRHPGTESLPIPLPSKLAQRPARGRWGGMGVVPPALRLTWTFKASFLKRSRRSGLLPEVTSLLAFPLMGLTSALPPAPACSRSSNAAAQAQVILDANAEFQAVSGLPVMSLGSVGHLGRSGPRLGHKLRGCALTFRNPEQSG